MTALGTIRCLRRRGIPAFVHGATERFLRWSRFYRPWQGPGEVGATREGLVRLLGSFPGPPPVLMPVSDPWAAAVSALAPEAAPSSTPPLEAITVLLDKRRLAQALDRCSVPRPRTIPLTSLESLRAALASGIEDAFLKPCDSFAFRTRFDRKAWRVRSPEEAEERFREASAAGLSLLMQEYVPGPATCHHFVDGFVDREGTVRALFARQRLRMHPIDFGDSSAMVSVELDRVDAALPGLRRLLRDLRYRGIFSAEFKRDPRDGVFRLIEVNARPWVYVEFAERAGVNVCEMAWRDALGLPVATIDSYRVGLRCVYPRRDLKAGLDLVRTGGLSIPAWLRFWAGAHVVVGTPDDPLPAVAEIWEAAAGWLHGLRASR